MWPFRKPAPWRQVDPDYAVTGQIREADLPAIKAAGFRSLVCTRPDGEDPGQPAFAELAAAAARLGLDAHHIPVSGGPRPEQVAEMQALMANAEGPVLGWCRSGARAETLRRMAAG